MQESNLGSANVCLCHCFLHDKCKYVIWRWCITGWVHGEGISRADKDGQEAGTGGCRAGHGRRAAQHFENNARVLTGGCT